MVGMKRMESWSRRRNNSRTVVAGDDVVVVESFSILVVAVELLLIANVANTEQLFHDTRQSEFAGALSSYEISIPTKVLADGHHFSHSVTHYLRRTDLTKRKKRSAAAQEYADDDDDETIHYKISVDGKEFQLELVPNDAMFSPGLVVERRTGNGKTTGSSMAERIAGNRCHFTGRIKDRPSSMVAIATCDGLYGYIHTGERDYFIEPVKDHNQSSSVGHPHLIYRRSALPEDLLPPSRRQEEDEKESGSPEKNDGTCGIRDGVQDEFRSNGRDDVVDERTGRRRKTGKGTGTRKRRKRSVSLERNVETLVVVDQKMMEYHRNENIENYVLTIMNMVSTMFHDASVGNAINIVVVRIIYLEHTEKDLTIQIHADHTLSSFCKWQMNINQKDDQHPNHHDVAVLLTRLDICSRSTEPCSTVGLSQVSGMCQPHRSCNINQDTGLSVAFTVTHELGHNFGMQHDVQENGCDVRESESQYIMSPQLTAEASPLIWSNCSRKAISAFLDRDWGYCLEDEPTDHEFDFPVLPPGVMYDIGHQCRLQYGPEAEYCDNGDDLCTTVWCRVDKKCLSKREAAAEGTLCGDNEWCFGGRCIAIGEKPFAIDSHWGEWGSWTECSRTCGAGVSHSERLCSNPPPSHGGRYCLGERKRFRICNTEPCKEGSPSFREHQCAEFNGTPYKGHRHEWEPVATPATPCQLHCKPRGRFFSVMLKDMVIDGTPCKVGGRDMCIGGRCRTVGCDWAIESDAKEDQCGVCHGDGTTCTTVKESFDKKTGSGYVEATIIPEGARNIRVEEVAEANNYLAIRNEKGDYYLNGDWHIQWSGDYEAAGTIILYRRNGNKESFYTPGPINEPLHVMLLFQSQNPGIILEYTVPNENATEKRKPEFHWKYSDWTHCTVSCGGGSQMSEVVCVEIEAGIVDDVYCNVSSKPDDMHKSCNNHQCPAGWWSGPWQHCSVSCGDSGVRKRTVLCVRQLGPDEQIALEDWECEGLDKPSELAPCKDKEPCPVEDSVWKTGPWSETNCRDDPCTTKRRIVECLAPEEFCDQTIKPPTEQTCSSNGCGSWKTGEWSKCTRTCNGGIQFRNVVCLGGRSCSVGLEPPAEQECNVEKCPVSGIVISSDVKNPETSVDILSENRTHDNENGRLNISDYSNTTLDGIITTVANDILSSRQNLSEINNGTTNTLNGTTNTLNGTTNALNGTTTTALFDMISTTKLVGGQLSQYRWMSLFWSECSRLCGEGYMTRRVMCVRTASMATVADDFCLNQKKPVDRETCQQRKACITWTTTAWQPCSSSCGEGVRQRLVSCALSNLCDPDERPVDREICNRGPCVEWSSSPWEECSQSCGDGVQQRYVECIDVATRQSSDGCNDDLRPISLQSCNKEECPNSLAASAHQHPHQKCSINIMSDGMCVALRRMGKCNLEYIQRKCCKACHRFIVKSKQIES